MTIKIQLPEIPVKNTGVQQVAAGWQAKVFSEDGAEIKDITSIDISIRLDEIVTATIDVYINKIENMDNVHALLGTKTLHDIAKLHGYELKKIGKNHD